METTIGGDLIGQGLELLLAGMGAVFVFLGLLVFLTTAMSRWVVAGEAPSGPDDDEEIAAAVTAAVRHHRVLLALRRS